MLPWGAKSKTDSTATLSYPVPFKKYPEVKFAPLSRTIGNGYPAIVGAGLGSAVVVLVAGAAANV